MTSIDRVPLLREDPELATGLSRSDIAETNQIITVPVLSAAPGEIDLERFGAVAAAVITAGFLTREWSTLGIDHAQALGPGDTLIVGAGATAQIVARTSSRVALLDRRTLALAGRVPTLTAMLIERTIRQAERAVALGALRQMPHADQRLRALFADLGERFGHVTTSGVALNLNLTHALLARLIGARRPTVTLALQQLADAGTVVRRRDRTWLLQFDPAAEAIAPSAVLLATEGAADIDASWGLPVLVAEPREPDDLHALMVDQLAALRAGQTTLSERVAREIELARVTRQRSVQLRQAAADYRLVHAGGPFRRT